jgi:hypothetical protein
VFIKWNTNLSPDGAAVGPVPNTFGQCKAIGILSECCPQSETIVKSLCGVSTGDRISLSDLFDCDGVVCEGQWAAVAGNTNLAFNECDLTVTVGAPSSMWLLYDHQYRTDMNPMSAIQYYFGGLLSSQYHCSGHQRQSDGMSYR